jgi:hypothetical protein
MDRLPDCTTIKETVKMGYIYIYIKKKEKFFLIWLCRLEIYQLVSVQLATGIEQLQPC